MDSYRKTVLLSVLKRPYVFIFLFFSISYAILNIWINELTWAHFTLTHVVWWVLIPRYLTLTIVSLLVGIVFALVWYKIKERAKVKKRVTGLSMLAAFGSLIAGGCAGCVAGLFPAFMSMLGLTFGLISLPLLGFEIHIISSVLLLISIYFLTKAPVCSLK